MFARNVSVHLKPNSLSQFTQTFENAVLPIMRKQSGYSSQQQQSRAPNLSVQIEQRTHSEIREPVTPIEHAMDIAIGADGKPWVERKRTAENGTTQRRTAATSATSGNCLSCVSEGLSQET